MIGFLYLAIAGLFGYGICEFFFPGLRLTGEKTFDGKELKLSRYLIAVPAWGVAGLIPLTWATYLLAYVLKVSGGQEYPLGMANAVVMPVFGLLGVLLSFLSYHKEKGNEQKLTVATKLTIGEIVFLCATAALVIRMMFLTFFVSKGTLYVGLSVFSDFAPHLGMIRSFSYGNNFPTSYSHFAGEDIRYHFLFQFLVGNLEFLGMRLDFAFNIPSIFGMLSTCVLLYALAARLTGKRVIGYLTTLFFLFRSSPSFFRYLATLPKGGVIKGLNEQTEFISFTQNEGWGFWNLNVYCNQRHLALALAAMLLALHFFLPYLYAMGDKLKKLGIKQESRESENGPEKIKNAISRFPVYVKELFFSKGAFLTLHPLQALLLGVLLGGLAFFNGSVLIATCAMLFFMAAFSDRRLDYLITAVVALALSLLESRLFVEGAVVSPKYYFGFLADNKTFFGAVDYMVQLWGILLVFLAGYLLLGTGIKRYLVFVFSVPLLLAFTLSLTVDIGVNHKFVIMAEMLLSVFPAIVIAKLMERDCGFLSGRLWMRRVAAAVLIVLLTITGIFEYVIVERRNQKENNLTFRMDDPVTLWLKENADSDDIILSSWYHLHRVVLGGGMLYYGWPYYAWSAGYDTQYRERMVASMFSASSPERLSKLISENNIRYIIVDRDARENDSYLVREDVISATYEAVYTEGENEWKFTIYDTTKRVGKE